MPSIRRTITIYPRYKRASDGLIKPIRCVLPNATWTETSVSIARETGNITRQNVIIRVFAYLGDRQYIPPEQWALLTDDKLPFYWTANIKQTTIVVDHETDHVFDWADDTVKAENAFVAGTVGARRVEDLNDNRRGTERSHHILMRA